MCHQCRQSIHTAVFAGRWDVHGCGSPVDPSRYRQIAFSRSLHFILEKNKQAIWLTTYELRQR